MYVFVSGLSGSLTKSGSSAATQMLSLDSYVFPDPGPLTFTLRNVGNTTVSIETVYFNGSPVPSPGCVGDLAPRTTVQCSFTPSPLPGIGASEPVKVITQGGGIYQFNVYVGGVS